MKFSIIQKFNEILSNKIFVILQMNNSILSYLSAFLFRDDLVGVVMADDLDEPRVEVLADSNL